MREPWEGLLAAIARQSSLGRVRGRAHLSAGRPAAGRRPEKTWARTSLPGTYLAHTGWAERARRTPVVRSLPGSHRAGHLPGSSRPTVGDPSQSPLGRYRPYSPARGRQKSGLARGYRGDLPIRHLPGIYRVAATREHLMDRQLSGRSSLGQVWPHLPWRLQGERSAGQQVTVDRWMIVG